MKKLSEILHSLKNVAIHGTNDPSIVDISTDSRQIQSQYLYAALPGTKVDGFSFIEQAISSGAVAVLCNRLPQQMKGDIVYIVTPDVPETLGALCSIFFDHPAEQLKLVGVTGTNGKTTVTTLLFNLFSGMGSHCGLISTVEYRIGTQVFPSTHTTPDVVSLYKLLNKMVEQGCEYAFMECSSHAIHQRRIAGLKFAGAIFTNITHDHLDYHGTFDQYIKAKKLFFDLLPAEAFALTNRDDKNGLVMMQNTRALKYSYALHAPADFTARILESDFNGTLLRIDDKEIWFNLVGEFNAYNLLAVYGAAFLLTEGNPELAIELSKQTRVNGRFETIQGPRKITAIVDYAHTPDALDNVIQTIRKILSNSRKLITVVGCGGDRDKAKRPEMGRIASAYSEKVIFTSDNPRSEDPHQIIEEMMHGVEPQNFKKVLRIADRSEAIKTAAMLAEPGDVILVAGKGHETYQEIAGVKHPFDDRESIRSTFNLLN